MKKESPASPWNYKEAVQIPSDIASPENAAYHVAVLKT